MLREARRMLKEAERKLEECCEGCWEKHREPKIKVNRVIYRYHKLKTVYHIICIINNVV